MRESLQYVRARFGEEMPDSVEVDLDEFRNKVSSVIALRGALAIVWDEHEMRERAHMYKSLFIYLKTTLADPPH